MYSLEASFSGCVYLGGRRSVTCQNVTKHGTPSQTRRKRHVLPWSSILPLDFQTNVQHRIRSGIDITTPFALDIALKHTVEGGVDNTYARRRRLAFGSLMDEVQSRDEELVRILLGVTREFS